MQAALQRAQQHILDLQEQHRLDLESCKQGHAAETARLRSDCYSFQNDLAEARQASLLTLYFPCWHFSEDTWRWRCVRGLGDRLRCVQGGQTGAHLLTGLPVSSPGMQLSHAARLLLLTSKDPLHWTVLSKHSYHKQGGHMSSLMSQEVEGYVADFMTPHRGSTQVTYIDRCSVRWGQTRLFHLTVDELEPHASSSSSCMLAGNSMQGRFPILSNCCKQERQRCKA